MKKFLLYAIGCALSMPSLFAYDVKHNSLCYDIVGTDENGNTLIELVRGDKEITSSTRLSIPTVFVDNGVNYRVIGIASMAFAGTSFNYLGITGHILGAYTFTFGEGCFKDCTIKNFRLPYFDGDSRMRVVFGENCFANITSDSEPQPLDFNVPVTICKGAFDGFKTSIVVFREGSDPILYGGAFDSNIKSAFFHAPVNITECDTQKVFEAVENITLSIDKLRGPYPYPSLNNVSDLADLSAGVTFDLSEIYQVVGVGTDTGSFQVGDSKLIVPSFLAATYAETPVWNNFKGKIENSDESFLTDEAGVIYKTQIYGENNTGELYLVNGNAAKGDIVLPGRFDKEYPNLKPSIIMPSAFEGNDEITSVNIKFWSSWPHAFTNCSRLTSVKIEGLTGVEGLFAGTPVHTLDIELYFECYNTERGIAFDKTISKLTLSKDCGEISGLTQALVPNAEIHSSVLLPATFPEQSQDVYTQAKVSVPFGTARVYKSTMGWSDFSNITQRAYDGTSFINEPYLMEVIDKEANTCRISRLVSTLAVESLIVPSKATAPDGNEFDVVGISPNVFSNSALSRIELPSSITDIGYGLFYNCPALKAVKLSPNITLIPDITFRGCTSLEEIVLHEGIIGLGSYAFADCESLREFRLPSSLEYMRQCVFENCVLDMIEINESDTELKVNEGTFASVTVKEIRAMRPIGVYNSYFTDGQLGWNKSDYPAVFYPATPIEKIVTGEKTATLEWLPTHKENIISPTATLESKAMTPPALRAFTQECYDGMTIDVPESALAAYKAAEIWKEFKNYRTATGVEDVNTTDDVKVYVADGCLTLEGAEDTSVEVIDLAGRRVAYTHAYVGEDIALPHGIYVVKAGNTVVKVKM